MLLYVEYEVWVWGMWYEVWKGKHKEEWGKGKKGRVKKNEKEKNREIGKKGKKEKREKMKQYGKWNSLWVIVYDR